MFPPFRRSTTISVHFQDSIFSGVAYLVAFSPIITFVPLTSRLPGVYSDLWTSGSGRYRCVDSARLWSRLYEFYFTTLDTSRKEDSWVLLTMFLSTGIIKSSTFFFFFEKVLLRCCTLLPLHSFSLIRVYYITSTCMSFFSFSTLFVNRQKFFTMSQWYVR